MKNTKLKFTKVKSGFEKLEGKYTGQFVSNGSDGLDEIADAICASHPTLGRAEVKLVVRALAAEVRRAVGDDLNYVSTGSIAGLSPAISGSVPSMDSALTEGENEIYVNIVALDHLRNVIGALTPTAEATSPTGVKLDYVEDAATHERGVIKGTTEFVLTGHNISARLLGESLALIKDDGSVLSAATLVGEDDGNGQRIHARLATAVPAGAYRLRLITHGYATPTADVETYTKKVAVA